MMGGPSPCSAHLLHPLHPLYLAELWINNDVGGEPDEMDWEKEHQKEINTH